MSNTSYFIREQVMRTVNYFRNKENDANPIVDAVIKKSIYISGPMTNIDKFNYPLFERVHRTLMNQADGYIIFSPHNVDAGDHVTNEGAIPKPYGYYFRKAVRMLMMCDTIVMLHGWEGSKGATCELNIARLCGMRVGYFTITGTKVLSTENDALSEFVDWKIEWENG